MNIDWSKAPEGTTHICSAQPTVWLREDGINWTYWYRYGLSWEPITLALSDLKRLVARPKISSGAWTGEGLPPVGTVCEFCRFPEKCGSQWSKVAIVAHWQEGLGAPVAIFMSTGFAPQADQAIADRFRPIRTAEQIAEEERRKQSVDLANQISSFHGGETTEVDRQLAEYLYNHDYRKQVSP